MGRCRSLALSATVLLANNERCSAYTPKLKPGLASVSPAPAAILSRSEFFSSFVFAGTAAIGISSSTYPVNAASLKPKLTNISEEEIKRIVLEDIVERSFLASADLTREIYDEECVFVDEIDSYTLEKWIKGTKSLFIPGGSRVSLVGDVAVSPETVEFRFDEDLMFNIPFHPIMSLSGKMILTRSLDTGLIIGYREIWDQDVNSVLKTTKFRSPDGTMKNFPF